jgi:hypothetical protein
MDRGVKKRNNERNWRAIEGRPHILIARKKIRIK